MSNISPIFANSVFNKDSIQEQASLWVSKMDRSLSVAEKDEFSLWIKQSKLHQETIYSFAALWDDLSVLNELSSLFPLEKKKINPKNRRTLMKYAIAASIAMTFVIGGSFHAHFFPNTTPLVQQFVEIKSLNTVVGQQKSFSLSDGSIIQLNTNSVVKINFSKDKRLLTLVRGEARFDVAKDKTRPFTVTAGSKSFTALGTIFNVQKTSDQDLELVVTEGRVLITKANQLLNNIGETLSKLPAVQLPGLLVTSGEKAVITKNIETPVQKVSLDQVQKDLAWQQGMLIFQGEKLSKALAEVSRYTTTHFEIADDHLADIKVAGYFKAGDIDGLLQSLSSNFDINFEKINKNSIRLTSAHKY